MLTPRTAAPAFARPALGLGLVLALSTPWALAQSFPITPAQQQTAQSVAQRGVPLSELAADAPERYTVKSGDTLWAISTLFLQSPWRWPELWGMNLEDVKNPHRIYPGQILWLERANGMARLRAGNPLGGSAEGAQDVATVKVSPRTRIEPLAANALPTLKPSVIEAFLAEPAIMDTDAVNSAPRIVATQEGRVLLSRGDRAYVRGGHLGQENVGSAYRVVRDAVAKRDPDNGEILGYEGQYVGRARLVRVEDSAEVRDSKGEVSTVAVPGTIDIIASKGEMRIGDRLLPELARELVTYTPHAPSRDAAARIVSVYGSSVANGAQNQVVAISKGRRDGLQSGHIFAILKDGPPALDKTDPQRTPMKLPNERNGLLMVFKTFERMSYALILENNDPVRPGDRLISPLR
ncbi:MAG: LysM peptidoglycan-binding domain-containing protein [Rhodoferax sp.]